jgi:hypothetical protein
VPIPLKNSTNTNIEVKITTRIELSMRRTMKPSIAAPSAS